MRGINTEETQSDLFAGKGLFMSRHNCCIRHKNAFSHLLLLLLLSRHIAKMKCSSYQFVCVVIHVVTSSHFICLISATCAMPGPIPNTITTLSSQTLDTGSYITWECSDGYMMDGLTNTVLSVCLEDGSWMVHQPICTAIKCPSPPVAAYSRLDPLLPEALVVNQTISYTCSSSEYTLLGRNLNRCLQDGTWENDPPVCQRKCDTADTRRYTDLTCFRTSDTQRTWGDSFDFCYDNGELLVTVKNLDMQNFIAQLTEENLGSAAWVWIGAREGLDWKWRQSDTYIDRFFWEIAYPDQSSGDCIGLSYQSNSGEFAWSPRSPGDEIGLLCQYNQSCQSVGLSQSDMVLEYMGTCFQFLDVSKNCDDGAEECNERGGFLAEILDESTNALLLDRALYLRDIGVNTAWWIGGYDENSGRSWYWSDKTRMNYEEWSDNEPSNNIEDCVEMYRERQYQWNDRTCSVRSRTLCQIGIPACGDPGEPLHGNRLPDDRTTYSVDATLQFTCQEGYTLSGESILRCMNDGAWNHQRPSCEAVECDRSPPEVALASTMILGSVYQDIALYTCQDSYIPDSEPICFCQHTGTWSTPYFTCSALSQCYSNTCKNGGTCYEVDGSSFACKCTPSYTGPTCDEVPTPSPTVSSPPKSTSAGGSSSSIATIVGSVVGAILVIVVVIVLIIIFYKRRSNELATSKSKGKESDSSPQYENLVFDKSQTDAHTYQGLNIITHTYQDCNTDVQSYDDTADPHTYQDRNTDDQSYDDTADLHTYQEPDQEANYEEVNDAKEKNYVNGTMIKQNKVILG